MRDGFAFRQWCLSFAEQFRRHGGQIDSDDERTMHFVAWLLDNDGAVPWHYDKRGIKRYIEMNAPDRLDAFHSAWALANGLTVDEDDDSDSNEDEDSPSVVDDISDEYAASKSYGLADAQAYLAAPHLFTAGETM